MPIRPHRHKRRTVNRGVRRGIDTAERTVKTEIRSAYQAIIAEQSIAKRRAMIDRGIKIERQNQRAMQSIKADSERRLNGGR